MAEGMLRSIAGERFDVESAGVAPSRVRAEAIEVMNEIGIDIAGHRSKSVEEFADEDFDYVITVCDNARETCPLFPSHAIKIHRDFEDPPASGTTDPETTLKVFRRVRDEIRRFLLRFAEEN
jgi:arsenate reductase (thioredoxin)